MLKSTAGSTVKVYETSFVLLDSYLSVPTYLAEISKSPVVYGV